MNFHAQGKLLLSGEYFVLDGALSLAIPTKLGQSLSVTVNEQESPGIYWTSYNQDQTSWFEEFIDLDQIHFEPDGISSPLERLHQLLYWCKTLNPEFLSERKRYTINTTLEFDKNWGLGTSSTLLSCLSQWANVCPYQLSNCTFGGSGYDIACATSQTAITYQLIENQPEAKAINFNPSFKNHLYFVYTGQKQNSRSGIQQYKKQGTPETAIIETISASTKQLIGSKNIHQFGMQIDQLEKITQKYLAIPTAKELIFSDFWGPVKSLGAWGGDFVLLVDTYENPKQMAKYFNEHSFKPVFPFQDLALHQYANNTI